MRPAILRARILQGERDDCSTVDFDGDTFESDPRYVVFAQIWQGAVSAVQRTGP